MTFARPDLSVLVCTYDRTDPLKTCLTHVRDQRAVDGGPLGLALEVIVVDNGPLGHSQAIVEAVFAESAIPARRVATAPPNISIARNRCLAEARAPLVLFLDDDQNLAPDAIAQALAVLDETGADIVLGRVKAVDLAGTPISNPLLGDIFGRRSALPRGAALAVYRPRRTPGFTPGTGLSLWRVSPWLEGAEPFDPAFGACGGEDLDLLMRVEAAGAKIHWAPDSVALEGVPGDRMTERYLITRAYSGAQVYAAVAVKNTPETPGLARILAVKGAIQAAVWGSLALLLTVGPKGPRLKARVKVALALGKLFWRKRIPLYQMTFDGESKA
ncbi:MAG: glycosyltransferase [Rhodospirillum sp.]|nr:glycosyltransferase [Rhodospirillum sp.]MCF8488111.1 glycosyltransferase [Rhodospirillum sp.]MCF8501284.1 glycosyltransferase [Rhodospirillum sp.]